MKMFDWIPRWNYLCIFLLLGVYGLGVYKLTSVRFLQFSTLFSLDNCKNHTNKAGCLVEKVNGLVEHAIEAFRPWFASLISDEIKGFIANEEQSYTVHEPRNTVKGNISIAMSDLLEKMQKEYESTLPGNAAKLVKHRLETIAFDYQKTSAFCTADFGLDPSVIMKRIGNIAEMTKMPRNLRNILEQTVDVIDAGSSLAQSTPIAVDGVVHFILIAAYRNANNSFDLGMAVFSIDYDVSPKDYQYGDEEMLNKILHFSKKDTVGDAGRLTFEGMQDLKAYFYGEAYKMFMYKCPSLLTGFRKVQQDIKSLI